jgi:hypothetical protein
LSDGRDVRNPNPSATTNDGDAALLEDLPLPVASASVEPRTLAERAYHKFGRHLVTAATAALVVSTVINLTQLANAHFFFASWASSAALILTAPGARSAAPVRVMLSHAMAALTGLLFQHVLPEHSIRLARTMPKVAKDWEKTAASSEAWITVAHIRSGE